jgi:hypothetical protein
MNCKNLVLQLIRRGGLSNLAALARRTEMRWLFYSPQEDPIAQTTQDLLEEYISGENLARVIGIENLERYFRRPQKSPSHLFLIINNMEEFHSLGKHKKIITDMKCLIGLTNRSDKELSRKAFEFYPRFIAYLPGDFSFLEFVLRKITGGGKTTRNLSHRKTPAGKPIVWDWGLDAERTRHPEVPDPVSKTSA